MKKLITLLLVLTGMVGTASAKTIYFADNWGKSGLRYYAWNSETDNNGWPGVSFPTAESEKVDGYSVYALNLGNYANFMIIYEDGGDQSEWNATIGKQIRKSTGKVTSGYNDGDYVDFSDWNGGFPTLTDALTVYTYTFNCITADAWSLFYIHLWEPGTSNVKTGANWPGVLLTGTENVYTYTHKSFLPSLGVLFNQGDGQPKTCDLTATPSENKFFIGSVISSGGGEYVKTNDYGYSTFVNTNALTIPSDIAYCAEEPNPATGSATAHTVTNPAGGTAMLIKGNANTTYHFATSSSSTSLGYTNAFKAGGSTIYSQDNSNNYNYVLNGDAFYLAKSQANGGTTVASGKAYLQLSKQAGTGANARVLIFPGDDETQGINAIPTAKANDGAYYNLSGQRVNAPTKGLYIQNGKKMIVK